MARFIFSGFTDEYSTDFDIQITAAKQFGMDMIELRGADGVNVADMTVEQIKGYDKKLRDNGIGVSSMGSPLGKIKLDGDLAGHMETARKVFEFANILGTKNIRMFSFYAPEGSLITQCKTQVVDALGHMLELAKATNVTLCHENEAAIYGETPERCLELLEQFGGELKAVFDMGNFVLEQVDAYQAYKLLLPYIEYFHIKDSMAAGAVVPPGKGEAQIKKILSEHIATATADTIITLEPHLQTFSGLNALVGKSFDNPYKYPDCETAFADAVTKLKELIEL